MRANTHSLHAVCLLPGPGRMELLRQIPGRNSICRGDERRDRGEREERRMKGQEEKKRSRVEAPGLIVHCHPALSPLRLSLHLEIRP